MKPVALIAAGLVSLLTLPATAEPIDLTTATCQVLNADLDQSGDAAEDWYYAYLMWMHGYYVGKNRASTLVPLDILDDLADSIAETCDKTDQAGIKVYGLADKGFRRKAGGEKIDLANQSCGDLMDLMDGGDPDESPWQALFAVMWDHGYAVSRLDLPTAFDPNVVDDMSKRIALQCQTNRAGMVLAAVEQALKSPVPPAASPPAATTAAPVPPAPSAASTPSAPAVAPAPAPSAPASAPEPAPAASPAAAPAPSTPAPAPASAPEPAPAASPASAPASSTPAPTPEAAPAVSPASAPAPSAPAPEPAPAAAPAPVPAPAPSAPAPEAAPGAPAPAGARP